MKAYPRIEGLEARIAPATLVSPTTVTYQDTDGDDVTVKISKPLFDSATIKGTAKGGTEDASCLFGITAETVGSLKVVARVFNLTAGKDSVLIDASAELLNSRLFEL